MTTETPARHPLTGEPEPVCTCGRRQSMHAPDGGCAQFTPAPAIETTAPPAPTAAGHLFGLHGAEQFYDSAREVYEIQIDGRLAAKAGAPWVIEEWTTRPPAAELPAAVDVIEHVIEDIAEETTEEGGAAWTRAGGRAGVREAFTVALTLLASHVGYRLCDELVATHQVTFDDAGQPLLDGQRLHTATGEGRP